MFKNVRIKQVLKVTGAIVGLGALAWFGGRVIQNLDLPDIPGTDSL